MFYTLQIGRRETADSSNKHSVTTARLVPPRRFLPSPPASYLARRNRYEIRLQRSEIGCEFHQDSKSGDMPGFAGLGYEGEPGDSIAPAPGTSGGADPVPG